LPTFSAAETMMFGALYATEATGTMPGMFGDVPMRAGIDGVDGADAPAGACWP